MGRRRPGHKFRRRWRSVNRRPETFPAQNMGDEYPMTPRTMPHLDMGLDKKKRKDEVWDKSKIFKSRENLIYQATNTKQRGAQIVDMISDLEDERQTFVLVFCRLKRRWWSKYSVLCMSDSQNVVQSLRYGKKTWLQMYSLIRMHKGYVILEFFFVSCQVGFLLAWRWYFHREDQELFSDRRFWLIDLVDRVSNRPWKGETPVLLESF